MTGTLALAVALSLASSPAQLLTSQASRLVLAQAPTDPAPQVKELNYSWLGDGLLTGTAAALWIGSEFVFKHNLAPTQCRILCERTDDGMADVNALDLSVRNALRWSDDRTRTAALMSDAMVYLILPATVGALQWNAAASAGAGDRIWQDYLLILEAAALAQVANQAVKFLVGRERPYSNALTLEEREALGDEDAHLSFYSGHATFSLALTVAAGTVASLRGYKNAWMLWAIAVPLAATVPYLRIAADKHYLTDVLVGSVMGAAFGVVIPLLHRQGGQEANSGARVSFSPAPGGFSIPGTF